MGVFLFVNIELAKAKSVVREWDMHVLALGTTEQVSSAVASFTDLPPRFVLAMPFIAFLS